MKINIGLYENGQAGDLEVTKRGFRLTGAIWTMIYTRLFGGNYEPTDPQYPSGQQRFDYWANTLFLKNKPEMQFNSGLPKLLANIPLISGNLSRIERMARNDLRYIADIVNIKVEARILRKDTLGLNITVFDPVSKQNKTAEFIINETNEEEIIPAPIIVPLEDGGGVLFEDGSDAQFEDTSFSQFENQ